MQPIFISYSSRHRDLTRALAAVLEAQYGEGSVWWDKDLESRAAYAPQIRAALDQARVVVVIWTAGAMVSDYVYAEAQRALEQGKLVNVRPADVGFRGIPEPFNIHHIDAAEDHARILATVAKVMQGTPIPTRVPLHEFWFRQHGRPLIDPKQAKLPPDPREIAPSELLQAKYGVVPYADVTGMAAELQGWCASSRPTAGRLLHGPGGLGKTRLLIHLAARLRDQGWTAGFLDRPHEAAETTLQQRWQALEQLIAHEEDAGLLLVLDYAEARQAELVRLARHLAERQNRSRPMRLVLLARSAGEWWEHLVEENPELERVLRGAGGLPEVTALPTIPAAAQRLALFAAARRAFAPVLAAQGYAVPEGDPSAERLQRLANHDDYERPLAVQIEALLWLASVAPDPGSTIDRLLDRVLGLERAHWKKLLGALDDDQLRDLRRAVAQVTLVQGTPTRAATERLLMADGFYGETRKAPVAVDPLLRGLEQLYGRADGIGPIEPDLLGEHHVATVADTDLLDGCLSWIETKPLEKRPERRRDLLTVLQRASQPEHGARGAVGSLLDHLIANRAPTLAGDMIAAMIETPGLLLSRVIGKLGTLDEPALEALDAEVPHYTLRLMELAVSIAQRRVGAVHARLAAVTANGTAVERATEDLWAELAARIGMLGNRLAMSGRREEALVACQQAVEKFRHLAAWNPNAYLPLLASSLNNFGSRLSEYGHPEPALAASEEAVQLYRGLVRERGNIFLPDLARSLNNHGMRLAALGRHLDALSAVRKAVRIHRSRAANRSRDVHADLADSLRNLSNRLSDLGRPLFSLARIEEAVVILLQAAKTKPDAYLRLLAGCMINFSNRLADCGRHDEALPLSEEAVKIWREIAGHQPQVFLPDLAHSLAALSDISAELGMSEKAARAAGEALEILTPFVERHPLAFAELAGGIIFRVRRYSEAAQQVPDAALLERTMRVLAEKTAP